MHLTHSAALNNAEWCGMVLTAHGIASTKTAGLWQALAQPIPLYPGLVTLQPDSQPQVETTLARNPHIDSVKDSFADLDLCAQGFRILLDGAWMLAPVSHAAPARPITTDAGFARWNRAWLGEQSGDPTIKPFPDSLRHHPEIHFAETATTPASGAILNRSAGVIGLTNTFGPHPLPPLVALAQTLAPGLPLLLWASGPLQSKARDAGFTHLGPMRVWLRDAQSSPETGLAR
jgi:hypothetical protein